MQRYGYSIFCDDIRAEASGKLSFIGCYNGVMFVSDAFPLILPKLCVHLHILSPANQPFSSIVARCYGPGQDEPIAEEPIDAPPREEQLKIAAELKGNPGVPRYIVAAASLIFEPMQLREGGLIRVRAVLDDDDIELPLGSLRVLESEQ